MGLKLLQEGNEKSARNKFNTCINKGSYYCRRKSKEALCSIGSIQDKNKAAIDLYEEYHDSDSLFIVIKQLESSDEIHKLIEYTNNIDFKEEYNDTIRIRLEALRKRNDPRYESEVYRWFTSRPISSVHYKFYRDFYEHQVFNNDFELNIENENVIIIPEQFVINYRVETYNKNYIYTYNNAPKILEYFKENRIPLSPQVASDIGKAYLYGDSNYAQNAEIFSQLADYYKDTELEFYFRFYTGRLFDKGNLYTTHAKRSFESAMNAANNDSQRDNALWYLLSSSLNFSLDSVINSIGKYSREISDPDYFDDFFAKLLQAVLNEGKWDNVLSIYKDIDGFASNEAVAQFAYVYARLAQEGYAQGNEESIKEAFIRACNSGYSIYYKALAAYRLDLSEEELEHILCMPYGKKDNAIDLNVEILLSGYAYFGFPDLIYPEWERLYKNGISPKVSVYLANFLNKCSTGTDDYYHQSVRIASRILSENILAIPKEYFKFIYPKNYSEIIEPLCKKYEAIPSTIYALVRSESFFNPNISSHAGAIGLAQLMEATGADIARKLKIKDYSLTDPATNLEFGISYITELIRRSDNHLLPAFFSYNAGITRVRRWKKAPMAGFGSKADMPEDLFLEVVPYPETKEYGRKILSAAVMYEWLYSDKPKEAFNKIIETLLF